MLHLRHIHRRKKQHTRQKSSHVLLDGIVYVSSIVGPIMTIPQIYDIWIRKSLAVNEITWGFYLVTALVWLYYGIVTKDKPIIFSNFLWVIAQGLVLVGALMFK